MKQLRGKSKEAIELDEDLRKWAKDAEEQTKQPWLDDIVRASDYVKSENYVEACRCFIIASQKPSEASDFLINATKNAVDLAKARQKWLESGHKEAPKKVAEITDILDDLFYKVHSELIKYQKAITTNKFEVIRAEKVKEEYFKKEELQTKYKYSRYSINDAIKRFKVQSDVLMKIYSYSDWIKLEYIEVTGAVLETLRDDEALSGLLKNSVVDISRVGGLVTHDQSIIEVIQRGLNENRQLKNPLILLKSNFTLATLAHELTHACIKKLDYYLHELGSLNNYSYKDIPEERLAFITEILMHQLLFAGDTFDEYIRIQAEMNLDSDKIIQVADPHVLLKKDIWEFLKSKGQAKSSNVLIYRDEAVKKFIAPILKRSSYKLLTKINIEANSLLISAMDHCKAGNFVESYKLYKRLLKIQPDLKDVVNAHIKELEPLIQKKEEKSLPEVKPPKIKGKALGKIINERLELFLDFFRPKWQNSRWEIRYKFISKLENKKNHNLLAAIAKNSKYWGSRQNAVEKLTDQGVLSEIAKYDKEYYVREAAVKRLTDQGIIAEIVKNDNDYFVRQAAVKRLTDQGVLLKIAKHYEDSFVRKAAVERLTDQSALSGIAINDEDSSVRKTAVQRLTDQGVLAEIAKNDKDSSVRNAAVKRLTDQRALAEVAKNAENEWIRKDAVEKLTDQSALAEVAKNAENKWIRIDAVERLTNQGVLAEIAINDEDSSVRETAVQRLTDQCVLAGIAKNDKDSSVRKAAVTSLIDQGVLAEIAKNDKDSSVRKAAVTSLTDQGVLAEIAKNDKDFQVREASVEGITDQSILTEIVKHDENSSVRETAVQRLTDQDLLIEIVTHYEDDIIRKIAIYRLNDMGVIGIVQKYGSPDISWFWKEPRKN